MSSKKAVSMAAIVVAATSLPVPSCASDASAFVMGEYACSSLLSALLLHHKNSLVRPDSPIISAWAKRCEENPKHSSCEAAAKEIRNAGTASPLSCPNGPDQPRPPRRDIKMSEGDKTKLDDACRDVLRILAPKSRQHREIPELPELIRRCGANPSTGTCINTEMMLELSLQKMTLSCGSNK